MLSPQQIAEYAKKNGLTVKAPQPVNPRTIRLQDAWDAPPEKPEETLVEKIAGFTGGKQLAQGIGKAIAKGGVEDMAAEQDKTRIAKMDSLIYELNKANTDGRKEDVARISQEIRNEISNPAMGAKTLTDFQATVPTNKEIIGSTIRLAGTAASPFIGSKVAALTGANKAVGVAQGLLRGAKAGAIGGVAEGAIQGTGLGLEANKDAEGVINSALLGAGTGGVLGGVIGGITGGITGKMRATAQRKAELKTLLETQPNSKVAKYKLNGQGQVANDPIAKEAIKQGVDEGTVATIKGSSIADKAKANKALDILEKGITDPKYKALNRPSDVLGESALERFTVVQKANNVAKSQLDDVAKSLAGKTADPTPAINSFISDLDDMGITFKNGKPNYIGSDIEGLAEPQRIIDSVVKRMRDVSDDGYELHRLKKFIDEQVTYGKTAGGLTGKTTSILKGLRHNVDAILDTNFPNYNSVNKTFATTRDAIDEFVSAGGSKFNPNSPNANARVGTLMRRILSNTQSRTDVLSALQKLQDVAEQNGGKFSDDIITQTVFINDLERLFGTSAPTSLAGEVTKGVQKASSVAGKMKNATGVFDLALEATGGAIDKARNISKEGLIKSLRQLLK